MTTITEDMNQVAVRILEDWAMMLVEPMEGDWHDAFPKDAKFIIGQLKFRGVVSGSYCVVCQENFAKALARNLLGSDEELPESQLNDGICEMVNVFSGNLLTSAYGEDPVFDLTSPISFKANWAQVEEALSGYALCYLADGEPVVVGFLPEKVHHGD